MSRQAEASRQQVLLALLWRRPGADGGAAGLDTSAARTLQGLAAYRGNARAVAERALAAAYPTIRTMLGEEDFVQHRADGRVGLALILI